MTRLTKKIQNTEKGPGSIHGILLDVYGVGILLLGKSGIGKSECALDLISKGHRLISDDLVLVKKVGDVRLIGSAPELSKDMMEVRGLGLINIRDLFGVAAVRDVKAIDLAVELVPLDDQKADEFERLGFGVEKKMILDIEIAMIRIPLWIGRNVATIIEVAAKNQLLRWSGKDSTKEFEKRYKEKTCGSS